MLLSLLWAVEASAGSRVSLLSFEGDRARSIRWRVAQALKRGGHTVLGFAPPSVRGSAAALRDYAESRNVDLFVSGSSEEGPQGLQLELRFRGSDGKPVAQPVRLSADNLRGLVRELKGDGLAQLEGAVRGGSAGAGSSSELAEGRALPLPKRRARARKVDDRPVLPGAAPVGEEPKAEQKRPPREVDLDAAVAGPGGGEAWDADGDEPSEPRRERRAKARSGGSASSLAAALQARAAGSGTKKRGAQRPAPAAEAGPIDLDADTRGALEESPADVAAAGDPLAEPAPIAADGSGSAEDPEPISIDDEVPEEEPATKPKRKKSGLFAGKLGRKQGSTDTLDSGNDVTLEDSEPGSGDSAARSLPNARLSARAGFMRRTLSYTDDLYNRLRTPTTNGWVYRLDAALYPFAQPLKDRLSLIGSYEGAVASTVRDERAGRDVGVNFTELEGGMRYRQPVGKHELGVQLTAGMLSAGLDGSAATSGVPEIGYTLLTPTADAGLHFGALTMRGSVSYQYLLGGLGEIGSAEWFPRAEGAGFKGQVGLEYRLSSSISLQASGAVRRFVLEMNSRPEDAEGGQAEVAGGAVDLYTSGYLGLAFTL